MNCPICGTGKAKKVRTEYRTKYDGQAVSVPDVEMFRCSNCHEDFLAPDQAESISIAVKNAVRRASGLLAPEKIVAIRVKLHLTQVELEQLLDQGPKVVTRWESGRVIQNKNADTILRMLDRHPELVDLVREIDAQRERAQRRHSRTEVREAVTA